MIPKTLEEYYQLHAEFFDATRWAFLFGRNSLPQFFPELPDSSKILDLGCGTGKHLRQLIQQYPGSDIYGIDLSESMTRRIPAEFREKVHLVVSPYTADLFNENQFDLIVCSYSLSMFSDIDAGLKNIYNHLKPNGRLIIIDFDSTPFRWFNRWMKKNHVTFDNNLFKKLQHVFSTGQIIRKKAYLGLYTYTVFSGYNDK